MSSVRARVGGRARVRARVRVRVRATATATARVRARANPNLCHRRAHAEGGEGDREQLEAG